MNYQKIQSEILKALCKGNVSSVLRDLVESEDGEKIYLVYGSGSHFLVLDKDIFFLDLKNKFTGNTGKVIQNIIKGADNAEVGQKTNHIEYIPAIKGNAVFLKSEKYEVLVDEKILKNFDKDCKFYLSGDRSPIYVYEGLDNLAGVVLPVLPLERKKEG